MEKDLEFIGPGSTKKYWFDKYQELKAQADANGNTVQTTASVAAEASTKKAIETASKSSSADMTSSMTKFINEFTEAQETYGSILKAIDAKKVELKEIHDIEVETNSLVALLATKNKLVAEKTEQADKIITDANEKAKSIMDDAKAAQEIARDKINAMLAEDKQTRTRERAEFDYDFSREKKQREDELEDILDKRTKAIDVREAAVKEREDLAEAKDKEIDELKTEIQEIKATMNINIKEAEGKAKGMAEAAAKRDAASVEASHKAELSIANSTIANLNARVEDLVKQVDKANEAVIDANNKVTDMATSALKATADAKTVAEVHKAGQKR